MKMEDWIERLHDFLTMTGRELLTSAGSVSHDKALEKARQEYEKFRLKQMEEPTEVEKYFVEVDKHLKKIESTKKE